MKTNNNNKTPNFNYLTLFFSLFLSIAGIAQAESIGKIEAGPTFLHVDVLESGKTIKKINMPAIRADANVLIWKGICLKPSFLYGQTGSTETITGGVGIGQYIPITDIFCITPSVGCNFGQFKTTIHLPIYPGVSIDLKERFRSISPYAGIDLTLTFAKGWRASAIFQYVTSYTNTTIKGFDSSKSHPKGPNYGLIVEGDINDKWSINVAGAYNTSLTKEKHGLRAYGVRLAAVYWF